MSARARRGAVLAIVAALLLSNPAYLGLLVEQPRSRSPTGYAATAVDPANATDQQRVLRDVGRDDVISLDELASTNEYQPYGDAYRAPGRAAAVFRRAVERENGTARARDDVAFTVARVAATYAYVSVGDDDARRYYRVSADSRGDDTVVRVSAVDRATVVRHVLHADARLYSSLPEYQRETVDEVIAADEYGYRPYNDEFAELTDDVVVRDGTYYVFRASIHADDFGPSTRELLSLVLAALGVLSLCAAVVLTALSYRGDESGSERERDAGGE